MAMGILAFTLISNKLGGLGAAIEQAKDSHVVRTESGHAGVSPVTFLTYMFIPLSVGMFPHLFQHWLTARSAKTFKLTVVAHPLCIMVVWVPCVLIGIWATGVLPEGTIPGAVLAKMVGILVKDPVIVGLVTAGILAAIMSSLDSQFLCLGTMFTNDIVLHNTKREYSDKSILLMARGFVIAIVVLTYILSLVLFEQNVFDLAVWSFSGFAALTPLVLAALYWRRATKVGAYASVLATAATWFYFFALSGFGGEFTVFGGVMPVAICWLAGAAGMIFGSLATRPPAPEVVERFFPKVG
jgi:SSS family solute:Na+ symporter